MYLNILIHNSVYLDTYTHTPDIIDKIIISDIKEVRHSVVMF